MTSYSAEFVATPGILLDKLIDAYTNFLEDQVTANERELRARLKSFLNANSVIE